MRILGYKKNSFKGNDGNEVRGYNVYLAYIVNDKDGCGYQPLRKSFWLSEKKLVEFEVDSIMRNSVDVEPIMNLYGKLAGFKVIEK